MGVGHLKASGVRHTFQKIKAQDGYHVDVDGDLGYFEHEQNLKAVKRFFTQQYGFKEVHGSDKIHGRGPSEKVLCETRHGVELRYKPHPSHNHVYFFIVVTEDIEKARPEYVLGRQHMDTYLESLKRVMHDVYGTVRRPTTAWTSEKIEVEESAL